MNRRIYLTDDEVVAGIYSVVGCIDQSLIHNCRGSGFSMACNEAIQSCLVLSNESYADAFQRGTLSGNFQLHAPGDLG